MHKSTTPRPARAAVVVLALALAACGKAPEKPAAPVKSQEFFESGWSQSQTQTDATITYLDGANRTGFSLTCAQATKTLHVVAPNPMDGATPATGEHASLVLGSAPFESPETQTTNAGVPFLAIDTAVTPQLLIALGDAKTARLLYRDGSSETGVDEEGKLIAFAQQCAHLTGVEPAL